MEAVAPNSNFWRERQWAGGDSDPVKFMTEKIKRLPDEVQHVLKTGSCIGAEFDEYLLEQILSFPVGPGLIIATKRGLIKSCDAASGKHAFVHDSVQQAAYSLIKETGKFHQQIGKGLQENLSEAELDSNIYIVVDQLTRSAVEGDEEKKTVATLCLRAGEKAMLSSAFVMAAEFFNLGIKTLGSNHWIKEYDLSLSLYSAASEAEYCSANFEGMEMMIKGVLANAKSFEDKLRVYTTQVYSLGTRGCLQEALDTGFDVLRQLGEPFPSKGRVPRIMIELIRTKLALRGREDASLLRLPIITNRDKISALRMLNVITPYTLLGRPDLTPLISARVIRLTLNYGLSALSSFGFANYGVVICGALGDIEGGFRYGQLALRIVDMFHGNEWIPRVYAAVYGVINIWKKPLSASLDPLLYAHRVGLESGDIEIACLDAYLYCILYDYAGKPLGPLEKELRAFWEKMVAYKQHGTIALLLPVLQKVLNLMGRSSNPCILTGEVLNEETALEQAIKADKVSLILGIYCRKLSLAYLFHEYELAAEVATKLAAEVAPRTRGWGKSFKGVFTLCLHCFYEGLTALALAYDSKARRHRSIARKNLNSLKRCARFAPENCLNKVLLLEAEFAALGGNIIEAMNKYECSIDAAGGEGLLHEQALACERAGMFLIRQGNESGAVPFLTRARSLYGEWGATAKVEHMNRTFAMEEDAL